MNTKRLFLCLFILLPLLFILSRYAAEIVVSESHQASEIPTNGCQFGKDVCQINVQGQAYLIKVVSDFSAGQTIEIELVTESHQVAGVELLASVRLLLQGKTMYMGISDSQLKFEEGKWVGLLRIPFCSTEAMQWQLDFLIQDNKGDEFVASYEFEMRHI